MPRALHQPETIKVASVERMAACISGGMSWMASFTETWLKPQDRHSTSTAATASVSSGRVTWWCGEVEADIANSRRAPLLARLDA